MIIYICLLSSYHIVSLPVFCFQKSPIQQCLSPALLCPLSLSSQPLLTSTLLELDKPSVPSRPQSPFPEDIVKHGLHYGFSLSAVSQVSLSQSSKSSGLTKGVKCSPTASLAVSHKAEVKRALLHLCFMTVWWWMDWWMWALKDH